MLCFCFFFFFSAPKYLVAHIGCGPLRYSLTGLLYYLDNGLTMCMKGKLACDNLELWYRDSAIQC